MTNISMIRVRAMKSTAVGAEYGEVGAAMSLRLVMRLMMRLMMTVD